MFFRMELSRQELQHNDTTVKEIRKLQTALKVDVFDTKLTLSKLNNNLKRLMEQTNMDYERFELFKKSFNELVQKLANFQMYLTHGKNCPEGIMPY